MLTKKKMEQNYQCKFCGTKFHKEGTLATHICVKKRRFMEKDATGPRFGFLAFKRFYEISIVSSKPKTKDDFIDSPYYIDFVKFGHYISDLNPLYMEKFIDFAIKSGLKLKEWTREDLYELYICDLVQKEPAISATERTITEIMKWAETNKVEFDKFFTLVSANEAAHMIRAGKISPWVLYLCSTGDDLMSKFNEDHTKMIGKIIDPGFWMKKFKREDDDVNYIRELLEQAGI